MRAQPAIKSYFFEKGFIDLKATIADSWHNNLETAEESFDKMGESEWLGKIFHFFTGLSVVIFGTLLFLVMSSLHIVILAIGLTLVYTVYSIVWFIDYINRTIKKVFMACPHCYKKSQLPIYHCPKCNASHDQLWPGKYGIFMRTCTCGHKMPTTFFNGRSKLPATCPNCGNNIESAESRPIVIPIIGAPSVGKTFFLFSSIYYIKEDLCKKESWDFEFLNDYNKKFCENQVEILNQGGVLQKTTETNPLAINFFLSKGKLKSLFYFYDSAGEAFASTSYLYEHKFYDYFHGLVFVIDPFSIDQVATEYNVKNHPEYKPSTYNLEDVFDASMINLEKNYGYKLDKKINKPVAIIISKIDAFDLESKLGKEAISNFIKANPKVKSEIEAINQVCAQFFNDNGMNFLLRKIQTKFGDYAFFPVSSKGKNSISIDKAMNWIINKTDSKFKQYS